MAIKKTYASGKTTRQLLNLSPIDVRELDDKSLKSVVQKLGRTVATRRRKAEKEHLFSAELYRVGQITTRGKSRDALYSEYIRAKEVLQAETTIKDLKDIATRFKAGIEKVSGENITEYELYDAMKAFTELLEDNTDFQKGEMRYKAYTAIAENAGRGMSMQELKDYASRELDKYRKLYKQTTTEMSSFFEV